MPWALRPLFSAGHAAPEGCRRGWDSIKPDGTYKPGPGARAAVDLTPHEASHPPQGSIARIPGIENDIAVNSSSNNVANATTTLSIPSWQEPRTTIGLLVLIGIIFVAQLTGAKLPNSGPGDLAVPDLVAFGALNRDLVLICGDWWRLVTAPLLHAGVMHVALNGVALFFAGRFIEQRLGGVVLAGLLAIGALAGTLMSMGLSDAATVSVGASGGIMALIAACVLLCYTLPKAADTIGGRSLFLRILVPSLIPASSGIDYAGHFGGAVAGGCVAAALVMWSGVDRHASVRRAVSWAAIIAYTGAALFGGARLVLTAPAFDPAAPRLAANAGQALLSDSEPEARALVATYPRDPQARLVLSVALYLAGKPAEAEAAAVQGLRQIRTYQGGLYGLIVLPEVQIMIALSQAATGGNPHALARIGPLCRGLPPAFSARVLIRPDTRSLCSAQ
jgi:rhomboid protease GluP